MASKPPRRGLSDAKLGTGARATAQASRRLLDAVPVATPDAALALAVRVDLAGLEVSVEEPPPPSGDDLVIELHRRVREVADKRERAKGEPIALGDDVRLDVVGYAGGKLLPFSARALPFRELRPFAELPGMAEALVGAEVGASRQVKVTLPHDYPVTRLGGQTATFAVDVAEAFEVSVFDPTTAVGLTRLGLGKTLDETMDALAGELDAEAGDRLLVLARQKVLEAFADRVEVDLPVELCMAEVRSLWETLELPFLRAKGFTVAELDEALAGWLDDEATRFDARRRVKTALGLRHLIETERIEPSPELVHQLVVDAAQGAGVRVAQARPAVRDDPEARSAVIEAAFQTAAIEHVMARARIHVIAATESAAEDA